MKFGEIISVGNIIWVKNRFIWVKYYLGEISIHLGEISFLVKKSMFYVVMACNIIRLNSIQSTNISAHKAYPPTLYNGR